MSISKVFEKLNRYFSLSEKKRKKRESEVKEILEKLQKKEEKLKTSIKNAQSKNEKELYKIELEVVKKLLKKTKKII